jgi:type II secretory pathway component PulF
MEEELAILSVTLGGLVLILIGIALLGAEHVHCTRREPTAKGPDPVDLGVVGWVLIGSGLVAATIWLLGGLVGLIAFAVLGMVVVRHRQAQQYALLSVLAIAARRSMPLAPAIEAFADERGGVLGWRARRLALLLRSGSTLPDALERTPGLVARQALVAIRVGQEAGVLAEALSEAVKTHGLLAPVWDQVLGRVLYLSGLLLFAVSVATYMILKIAPEMQKIFDEFDAELPPVTKAVFAATEPIAAYWLILGAPILLILLFLFLQLAAQHVLGVRWDVPGVNWITRRLDSATILDALALAAERNVPFQGKIATLARSYPRRPVRRKLEETLRDVDAGADWCETLARRGLIRRAEWAVFQAAERAGNLAWALREMADGARRRLAYRLYALLQVLFPAAILAVGLLVMFYVVGYFMPMVSLIGKLTK